MKKKIAIIMSIVLAIVLCAVGVVYLGAKFVFNFEVKESTRNIEDYEGREKIVEECQDELNSLLMIFPDLEYESMNIESYLYEEATGLFASTYEIMISYTLDDEDYKKEIERLVGISLTVDEETHKVTYTTEGFNYPAYVAAFEKEEVYEYALIDKENNRIICVFCQYTTEKISDINNDYMPTTFSTKDMLNQIENIYYFQGSIIKERMYEINEIKW